jgi:hypothetical protein
MQSGKLTVSGSLGGFAVFVATPPIRNIGIRALDMLDHCTAPCFKITPLLALGDQRHASCRATPRAIST